MPDEATIRWAETDADIDAAYALFRRRIGVALVEDEASFRISVSCESADWIPRLGLAEVDGRPVAAQLGGLLPAVRLLSLPYTAVAEAFEGRGIYRMLKLAMIERLRHDARAHALPEPEGNVAEEPVGSAQYRRKVGGGIAVVLPVAYRSPAAQGLRETPLALTYEPLTAVAAPIDPVAIRGIVAAIYRGIYRIAAPEQDPTFRRVVATLAGAPGGLSGA